MSDMFPLYCVCVYVRHSRRSFLDLTFKLCLLLAEAYQLIHFAQRFCTMSRGIWRCMFYHFFSHVYKMRSVFIVTLMKTWTYYIVRSYYLCFVEILIPKAWLIEVDKSLSIPYFHIPSLHFLASMFIVSYANYCWSHFLSFQAVIHGASCQVECPH